MINVPGLYGGASGVLARPNTGQFTAYATPSGATVTDASHGMQLYSGSPDSTVALAGMVTLRNAGWPGATFTAIASIYSTDLASAGSHVNDFGFGIRDSAHGNNNDGGLTFGIGWHEAEAHPRAFYRVWKDFKSIGNSGGDEATLAIDGALITTDVPRYIKLKAAGGNYIFSRGASLAAMTTDITVAFTQASPYVSTPDGLGLYCNGTSAGVGGLTVVFDGFKVTIP